MVVEHPKPSGGTSASRRVRVTAKPEPAPSKARPSSPRSRAAIDGCGPSSLVLIGALLTVLGVLRYANELELSDVEGPCGP